MTAQTNNSPPSHCVRSSRSCLARCSWQPFSRLWRRASCRSCCAIKPIRNSSLRTFGWRALARLAVGPSYMPFKFAEGGSEADYRLRLTLLLLGALVGLTAWGLGDVLMLKVPGCARAGRRWARLDLAPNARLAGFDRECESLDRSLRRLFASCSSCPVGGDKRISPATRGSALECAVCIGWSWFLHLFWWFPQPLGMMAAGVIAISSQLASPWMPPANAAH